MRTHAPPTYCNKYNADCHDKFEHSTCKASPFRAAKRIFVQESYPIRMIFAFSYGQWALKAVVDQLKIY